jgi:dephospho-CoA kinase
LEWYKEGKKKALDYERINGSRMKKTIFYLVGNYGVGKSSIIKEPILSKRKNLIEIRNNLFVLGEDINGADSLSSQKKDDVIKQIILNRDKNIIIAGIYYTTIKDIKLLSKYFNIVLFYLKTSFEENAKRIALRGKLINVETYNAKLTSQLSLIKNTKGFRKLFIIENDRPLEEVKAEIYKIIEDETNRTNTDRTQL